MAARVGRELRMAGSFWALTLSLAACDRTIVLGARTTAADADSVVDAKVDPISTETDVRLIVDAEPGDAAASTLLWSADHETGDLSPWHLGGDQAGGHYAAGGSDPLITTDFAHKGSFAVKCAIDTSDGQDHTAQLYRRAAPVPAYYSAWFYWNDSHSSFGWWTMFLFRALSDPQNLDSGTVLWDIGFERRAGGQLALLLYDHRTLMNTYAPSGNVVPVSRWVHLEAYFAYSPQSTRITIWQDGTQVFDANGLGQPSSNTQHWAIGNGANGLVPSVSDLYIDDAAISTVRLGPVR